MDTQVNQATCLENLLSSLSTRERQLVKYFATAYSNVEIAMLTNISPATVKTHKANVYKKLGVKSLKELMLLLDVKPTYSLD